ncbi:MAG TPA: MFS transporter [Polyangia bacterium]|jgi:PPP family 3-phenylpropionic acid transporter|nr:MFS transporter [Polyangia bacterium]
MLVALYYFGFFAALGVFLPYFSLWLVGQGLTATEATRVLAMTPLMSLVAPPLFGLWADARRARVWLLRGCSLMTFVAFSGFFVAHSRLALYGTTIAFALFRSPLIPLSDAVALEHVRRHGGSYGRLRLWGSLGFLLAVWLGGILVDRVGQTSIIVAASLGTALCAACAWAMPAPPVAHRPVVGAWLALLESADWWIFFAAIVFGQLATAAYDSGFTLHLTALGFSGRFVGVAWAVGVAAEIALMALSSRIIARIGAAQLLTLAFATAVVRWLLVSCVTSPTAILCLQPLHGVTFGLFWVAAVTLVRERGVAAPTAAQGLLAAALGLGALFGMHVTGALLDAGGGRLLYRCAAAAALAATSFAAWYARRTRRIVE